MSMLVTQPVQHDDSFDGAAFLLRQEVTKIAQDAALLRREVTTLVDAGRTAHPA